VANRIFRGDLHNRRLLGLPALPYVGLAAKRGDRFRRYQLEESRLYKSFTNAFTKSLRTVQIPINLPYILPRNGKKDSVGSEKSSYLVLLDILGYAREYT
jgi:hypothetical protein